MAGAESWADAFEALERAESHAEPSKPHKTTLDTYWRELLAQMGPQQRKRVEDHIAHGGRIDIRIEFS